jgi:hypothetical protein
MNLFEGKRGHGIAMAILFLIPLIFFWQMIVGGQEPLAPDTQAVKPLGKWAIDTQSELGEMPLWCNGIMSGMPSHGSFIYTPSSPLDLLRDLRLLFRGSRGARYFISLLVAGVGMYLLLSLRRKSPLCALTGALIFVMTPYMLGLVAAGHSTKLHALCLAPAVFLALELLLSKRSLLAAGLLAALVALQFWANHPQVSYYTLLLGALYTIGILIFDRPEKWQGKGLGIGLVLGVLALALAGGMILDPYASVLEYMPHSIRGGTGELASAAEMAAGGVSWDYATAWSYPLKEVTCFLFPAYYGLEGMNYWGEMTMTQSTHYFGAAALLIALIGLFMSRGRRRWILLAISLIVLLIGFGRNFPVLYRPLFEILPMFNKFRVPAMIYSMLPLFIAILAAEGLQFIKDDPRWAQGLKAKTGKKSGSTFLKHWQIITIALVAVTVLWLVAGNGIADSMRRGGDFVHSREASQLGPASVSALKTQSLDQLRSGGAVPWQVVDLVKGRMDLLWRTVFTGLLLLAIGALVLELRRRGKLNGEIAVAILALLIVADLWEIDRKFYHPAPKSQTNAVLVMDPVARFLKSQPGDYRIAPLSRFDTSPNRYAAFGLESILGYSPAKLRLYDDLLQSGAMNSLAVLSMLSAKYIITDNDLTQAGLPLLKTEQFNAGGGQNRSIYIHQNPVALPRAWFVSELKGMSTAQQLMEYLLGTEFEPSQQALMLESDRPQLTEAGCQPNNLSSGEVTGYESDASRIALQVQVTESTPGLLVFSEIYYEPGWKASIDGADAPIHRVNHVLRAMVIPPGTHEIEMIAQSGAWQKGKLASSISALLVIVMMGSGWVLKRFRSQ